MNYLEKLIGKIIENILTGTGTYYPIKFKPSDVDTPQLVSEVVLKIEDHSLSISNPITTSNNEVGINSFVGKKISFVMETKSECTITTEDGEWIAIDLRDESYTGPEAMALNGPNNLFVVWN